jgi:hypothetical protein
MKQKTHLQVKVIFMVLLIFIFVGCETVHLISMTPNINREFTIIKHFKRDLKAWFTILGLVTISDPKVEEVIREEILKAQGDRVVNLEITGQTTILDGLIPVAVGNVGFLVAPPYGVYAAYLIGARTYTIEGDIIKYTR